MPQQIQQEVLVDIKETGGESVSKLLDNIDKQIKNITASTSAMNRAFNALSTGKLSSIASQLNKMQSGLGSATNAGNKAYTVFNKLNATGFGMKNSGGASGVVTALAKTSQAAMQTETQTSNLHSRISSLGSTLSSGQSNFKNFIDTMRSGNSVSKDLSWNFFRTRAAIAAIIGVAAFAGEGIKKWFDLSSDYAESSHLFYSTLASSMKDVSDSEKNVTIQGKDLFGNLTGQSIQATQSVADCVSEVNRLSSSLMLDPTNVQRTYSTFYEMANAAGMSVDKVGQLSQGMTQLTYDLASLWDMPFSDAAKRLQSGLSGISTAVRSMGIDISRTAADQWLMDNGINASYKDLTRQNKMIVMYNMMLEHTATAQGDLARSALQPANMLRILGQQSTVAARAMGAAILPVATKLIPIFIMLAQAIQRAAASLAAFLGSKLGDWYASASAAWQSYMSNLSNAYNSSLDSISDDSDDASDSLDDVGDSADSTADKLNKLNDFSLNFDELNVLPDQSTSTSGSGTGSTGTGSSGTGSGVDIPLDSLYNFDDTLQNTILSDAKNTMAQIKQAIDDTFGTGTADAFHDNIIRIFDNIKYNAGRLKDSIKGLLDSFAENWSWVDFLNGVADGFTTTNDAITTLVTTITDDFPQIKDFLENLPIVGDLFKGIFDNLDSGAGYLIGVAIALKPVVWLFKALKGALEGFAKLFEPFQKAASWFGKLFGAVGKADGETEGLGKIGTALKGLGKVLEIVGIILRIGDVAKEVFTDVIPNALDTLSEIFTSKDPIKTYFDKVVDYVKNGKFIQQLFDFIFGPGTWDQVKDTVNNALLTVYVQITMWVNDLGNAFNDMKDKAVGKFKEMGDGIGGAIGAAKDAVVGKAQEIWNGISDAFNNAKDSAVNTFWDMYNGVTGAFSSAGDKLHNLADDANNGIMSAFYWLKDNVGSVFGDMGQGAVDAWNWAGDRLKEIADWIGGLFNFQWSLPDIKLPHFNIYTETIGSFSFPMFGNPPIEWYANGGVFNGATIAGIGEAGPEAAVPLSGARMKPFAQAIAQNMNGGTGGLDGDALVTSMATAVYNAVVKGFPTKIESDVYMDATKVGKVLDKNSRQSGTGTSLVTS